MAVFLQKSLIGDGFGTKFNADPAPTTTLVAAIGTVYYIGHHDGTYPKITWEKIFPGAVPAGAFRIDLEGCNGDPTVAANWFSLDTSVDIVINEMREVLNKRTRYIRINLITLTTPNGGVAGRVHVG